jgi:hypothetical protein
MGAALHRCQKCNSHELQLISGDSYRCQVCQSEQRVVDASDPGRTAAKKPLQWSDVQSQLGLTAQAGSTEAAKPDKAASSAKPDAKEPSPASPVLPSPAGRIGKRSARILIAAGLLVGVAIGARSHFQTKLPPAAPRSSADDPPSGAAPLMGKDERPYWSRYEDRVATGDQEQRYREASGGSSSSTGRTQQRGLLPPTGLGQGRVAAVPEKPEPLDLPKLPDATWSEKDRKDVALLYKLREQALAEAAQDDDAPEIAPRAEVSALTPLPDSVGNVYFIGYYKNTGTVPIAMPSVELTLWGEQSNKLAVTQGYAPRHTLGPGEETPIRTLFLHAPAKWQRVTASVTPRAQTFGGPRPQLRFTAGQLQRDRLRGYRLEGTVQNQDTWVVRFIQVIVVVYDKEDRIIGMDSRFIGQQQLSPGESAPFAVPMLQVRGRPHHYRLDYDATGKKGP